MEIPKAEGLYVEFKREDVAPADFAEEVVAFANGEGGEIWLGVDDSGAPCGLSRSYETDVINICRTACIPAIQPLYEETALGGQRVARVTIPKGLDKPYYTSRNRYYIRVGSTKRIASREELVRLFMSSGAFHYDLVELDRATQRDLDWGQIGQYFSRYQLSFFDEPESERVRLATQTDLLGPHGRPTVAGLLLFGLSPERLLPQCGIDFAHFAGLELTDRLHDKQNLRGPLPRQVEAAVATIKANIAVGSRIRGVVREDDPHYPDAVYRELIVNACVHRNYSIAGSAIRVLLFDDRLEVRSPGRLPNTVTIDKLPVGTSFARNPILVRLMENLGYVDKLGRGLPMVWQAATKLGLRVGFEERGEDFTVTLPLPNDGAPGAQTG